MMEQFSVEIKNCNSIESANITIRKGALNIKYGPNGIGKSTIVKAIAASIAKDGSLSRLKPFKHRKTGDGKDPLVSGIDGIESVLIFDDAYISQFAFQPDEVVKNSFEIFIKTETYVSGMKEIEELFSGIKSSFEGNESLITAISDLKELRDAFGVTKSGVLSKASKGYKAYGSGNKIENIPDELKPFEQFIKSDNPSGWISWQAKGNSFLDLSDNCPYCASDIKEPEKKNFVKKVSQEYDSKAVEHLNTLQVVINRLGKYFTQICIDKLEKVTKAKVELSPEAVNFLSSLRGDVETLIGKLEGLRAISFFSLRDIEEIEKEINKLKIELNLLENLNSFETKNIVDPINMGLEELISRVGVLKGNIGKHKKRIEVSILENQKSINEFLESAGYKYSVVIKPEADSYKMKLVHQDFDDHIEAAAQHLSYGEKNAFALVLFMHQVLSQNPTIAILDDPVSSFDKTKKFAILNELFRGKISLKNNTILMVTHDIEPAIDVIKSVRPLFVAANPTACFLASRDGKVIETEIRSEDIQTFAQICSSNISAIDNDVIKCIYLRRHFEIVNDLGVEYNCLASLLHGKDAPTFKDNVETRLMTSHEIERATSEIKKWMPNFDYTEVLSFIKDRDSIMKSFHDSSVGYDKLQLFRVLMEVHGHKDSTISATIKKFVNESFHIENEYLMQLNPHKFDNIPGYIIDECQKIVQTIN
ncbi:AAA family ATPase [Limnohabitans radicicola]|nr:AAA family ATPase [Limnohabitans radicicola]